MLILIIIFFLLLLSFLIYLLFKLIKWIFRNEIRKKWGLSIFGLLVFGTIINTFFFIKMEFLQSKVYPNLYLIKKPIEDKDALNKLIKQQVIQQIKNQFFNFDKKKKYKYYSKLIKEVNHSIQFYEYYKAWGFIPFGEAGTAYFIENEEDFGGFSSELLQHYPKYKIAVFSLSYYRNDTINYFGKLEYFKDEKVTKTDTIIKFLSKKSTIINF